MSTGKRERSTMSGFAQRWVLPFFDPRAVMRLAALPRYVTEMNAFRRMAKTGWPVAWRDTHPCLSERTATTPFDPHYFYQSAWLARRLVEMRPAAHVDIGSSVMMINAISAIVPVTFVDIRPLVCDLSDLKSIAGSIVALPFADASQTSISCLHVIEHIGLGRYGDRVDPEGYGRALAELARVAAPGGRLYISTPVGRQRVCFNAHRVFDPATIIAGLPGLSLTRFSLVDDSGRFQENCTLSKVEGLDYGCGLFEFQRRAP